MSRGSALAAISSVASGQWGMFTAGQARRLEVSRADLTRLVHDGVLAAVDQTARVYRLTGAPDNPELDPLRAAWLQLGGSKAWHERISTPDAVVCHRSAAHLRGLGDLIPAAHEFYISARLRPRRPDIRLRVRSKLDSGSWEVWDGLPVSTVPTIIQDLLGDREDESAVAQVVRDALGRGLLRVPTLRNMLGSHAHVYGHADPAEFLRVLTGEAEQA